MPEAVKSDRIWVIMDEVKHCLKSNLKLVTFLSNQSV